MSLIIKLIVALIVIYGTMSPALGCMDRDDLMDRIILWGGSAGPSVT